MATTTSATSTLSLHDALPIWRCEPIRPCGPPILVKRHERGAPHRLGARSRLRRSTGPVRFGAGSGERDRKSTRLNSSHLGISYAVFCLKKKKIEIDTDSSLAN